MLPNNALPSSFNPGIVLSSRVFWTHTKKQDYPSYQKDHMLKTRKRGRGEKKERTKTPLNT